MSSAVVGKPSPPKLNTRAASLFRNPIAAFAFGVVLPLICLTFDPIVFRTTFGQPILGSYKISSYGIMALATLALAAWLSMRRLPSLFCGFLLGGCAFAVVLGVILLPMSMVGLMAIIGILGFSPFVTAATFWYSAMNARNVAGDGFKPVVAASAFIIIIVLPIGTHAYVFHVTEHSIDNLVSGSDLSAEQAIRRLGMLGPAFDADELVWRYDQADSKIARDRLANAYTQLTGGDIQQRLGRLFD